MSKLRIFVVDDDRDFADTLADLLRLEGHDADTAYSGEDALAQLGTQQYDLTLLDVRLPGRNGVESFLEMRRLNPNAQVYLMTAFSVEGLVDRALASGARGVLAKPLDLHNLLSMINCLQA